MAILTVYVVHVCSCLILYNTGASTQRSITEAEVRFHVTDPIMKGILRCTGCAIAAEESILKSHSGFQISTSQPSTSVTPSQQRSLSEGIVPDYTIYLLSTTSERHPIIAIVEVKRLDEFNEKSVCQAIGYHVASRLSTHSNVSGDAPTVIRPLLILVCEEKLKFIFLPFVLEGSHCIDAIVTPVIDIFEKDDLLINKDWFIFACLYIVGVPTSTLKLMEASEYTNLKLHKIKTYEEFMDIPTDVYEQLKEENEDLKEKNKDLEDEIKRLKAELQQEH